MSARELLHWSPYLNLCPEGLVLMLKKQDIGINPYVPNNGSRDQSLTGIGGPRVYVGDPGPDTGTVSRCHPPIARWGDCNERRALVSRSEWCEVVTEAWGHEVIVRIFDYLIVKNNFLDIRYFIESTNLDSSPWMFLLSYAFSLQGTGDMTTGHKMASAVTLLTALRMFTNGEF